MRTVLQVEDDPNDVLFLRRAMAKVGVAHPIRVVKDGREAINYLQGAGKYADREQFPFPDIVLLDLKLPQVMGLEVLRWIRQTFGMSVIVIVLTSSGEDQDIAAAYNLCANAFLIKPCETHVLEQMVKAISEFWLKFNCSPEMVSTGMIHKGVFLKKEGNDHLSAVMH